MGTKKLKKDFDKERMYAKIMPSLFVEPSAQAPQEPPEEPLEDMADDTPPPAAAPAPAYILRNYMEDIILEKFAHTMKMLKACTCEICQTDVMAYALNSLPPAYMAIVPEDVEDSVRQLRAGMDIKVTSALIKAVQHVKTHPGHD